MRDEEEKINNDTPDDQLRRKTEEKSYIQLNMGDRDSSIQLSDIVLKRSSQEQLANLTSCSQQSIRIKNKMTMSANVMCSVSTSRSISKSHIHMVTVLANLNAVYDDSGPDELLSLKEAIASPYWKNFEKAMYSEFQSLIENDTWEYKNTPLGRAILTGRWVFKIEKD